MRFAVPILVACELSWHRFDPFPPMRTQMACELGERLVCTARDLR
jgi:hypothetical protein